MLLKPSIELTGMTSFHVMLVHCVGPITFAKGFESDNFLGPNWSTLKCIHPIGSLECYNILIAKITYPLLVNDLQ
jgi:hypothetical protein